MDSQQAIRQYEEDDISLKRFILKAHEWAKFLLGKLLVISISGGLCAGLGLIYAVFSKPEYTAELTFVLEDNKANPLGAYVGLASQFGIDIGGSSTSGLFSGDNIMEFLKSRLMIEKALLSPTSANNKSTSLADLYISINNLNLKWQKKPELKHIHFPPSKGREDFSRQEDSVLLVLYKHIIEENLVVHKPDKKLNFISVECTALDELFAKYFTLCLVKEATDFYVQTKTQRTRTTVDKLQATADSIKTLLNQKTISVATTQDMNFNASRSQANVKTEFAMRDKIILQTVYTEVVKNLELSKMTMAQETPIIQIVDQPILPLEVTKFGKLKGVILGGVIGALIAIITLITRRIYRANLI
ncbi:lipopolysaccharide biosynthesis protein [Chitinophaga cymbidii]|uniref:Polysaccharide chain length determinant N-terminal domain-containing protein n=1 Tax=Chitinophaga cymbidii TaxID=1096750 RepID=A0A512RGE2_9BACT|nr:lipopolysaccharide biosynthesis protein [Chitinophaga cymbidii]GEP94781.1 hypothetical protein CCY01nite_10410 [Chitinophaga cymbidii]